MNDAAMINIPKAALAPAANVLGNTHANAHCLRRGSTHRPPERWAAESGLPVSFLSFTLHTTCRAGHRADGTHNGEVNVTKTDIAASNGLIHVVDSVLLPSS